LPRGCKSNDFAGRTCRNDPSGVIDINTKELNVINTTSLRLQLSTLIGAAVALASTSAVNAADEAAARTLARQSNCFKCHSVDKKKDGPAWRDVAAKYRDKPDAEATLTHHITSGEKVKFEDGHEEDHTIVKSKDPQEIKNLVDWILSLK
jgi:cytochrome c